MNFVHVGQEGEDVLVAERHEEDTVGSQGGERAVDGYLLPSTRSAGGNENTGVLSSERSLGPEATGSIPECLSRIRVLVRLTYLINAVTTFH